MVDKPVIDKYKAIARLNSIEVNFEAVNGTLYAYCKGVSFKVNSYRSFDAKLKEIKRMPPKKRLFSDFINGLFRRGSVS